MFKVNDVVQIVPTSDEKFGGCFLVVTEVKSWGVQGYITVLGERGLAYYRAKNENIVYIGTAEWIAGDKSE